MVIPCSEMPYGTRGCSTTSAIVKRLEGVQRSAQRLMSPPLAADLRALSHRRAVTGLTLVHRLLHERAPEAVRDLCPTRAPAPTYIRPNRRGNTASRNPFFKKPKLPQSKDHWSKSFIPLHTEAFNHLSSDTQSILKPRTFKKSVNSQTIWEGLSRPDLAGH